MPPETGPELEPQMEHLLGRLVPDFASRIEGVSLKKIAAVERIAGRPLPRYYRWFLERMGKSMGPFGYRSLDFSLQRVLDCHANGTFERDPRFLMIGYEADTLYPAHIAYDLDHSARDDARVSVRMGGRTQLQDCSFETLREMHAHQLLGLKVTAQRQRANLALRDRETRDVAKHLTPVMGWLGFTSPIETGPHCLLFERKDAVLIGCANLDKEPAHHSVHVGARNEVELRNVLKAITRQTGIEVEVDGWDPRL
jgi:hypothetical protein